MNTKVLANFIFWLFVGGGIGALLIAPTFNIGDVFGGLIGCFLGLLLALAVADSMPLVPRTWIETRGQANHKDRNLNFLGYLLYPTQLPMTLGIMWFIGCVLVALSLDFSGALENLVGLLLFPTMFGFGATGVSMLLRKETIIFEAPVFTIVRGDWAKTNGIRNIFVGWGACVVLILATILHW